MTAAAACTNCGTALAGRYCHACGQDGAPPQTAVATSRAQGQRLWRTLHALMLRPGLLTREHLSGGRVRYIAPFTLFLNVVAVFFLLSVATGFHIKRFVENDSTHHLAQSIERRADRAGVSREVFLERLERRFQGVYTLCLACISLLGYAALFRLVFRKSWHGWRGPFTLALHYLAFIFVALPAVMVMAHYLSRVAPPLAVQVTAGICSVGMAVTWLSLAIRRLFGERWPWAIGKALMIVAIGTVVDQAMFVTAVMLTFTLA